MRGDLGGEGPVEDARLDDRHAARDVDAEDPVQPGHGQNDASVYGVRSAGEASSRGPGHHGDAPLVRESQRRNDVLDGSGAHERARDARRGERRLVARVRQHHVGIYFDGARLKGRLQLHRPPGAQGRSRAS